MLFTIAAEKQHRCIYYNYINHHNTFVLFCIFGCPENKAADYNIIH